MNPRDIVHDGGEVRNGLADLLPTLAVGFELPDRGFPRTESVLERFDGFAEVARFSVVLDEVRFEVEQVKVACGSGHEELDDSLRFCAVRWEGA